MVYRPSSALRLLLIAVAVCAVNLMSLDSAQATCGDYLSHAGQNDTSVTDLLTEPTQLPPAMPCSGPGCQKHRPDPVPEAPVLVITVLKPACSAGFKTLKSEQRQTRLVSCSTLLCSSANRARIDRPPQLSGS
ncbi:hypothetical protein Mal35_10180 [Gimesia maris]|uniref:hypothetical protein n=1 Tax=Gimesia maris TaxID=122 RepID=UPI0011890E81|nr:hypothetical protein [Gimesia maris]QDT77591.1 hypothetical protein Mal35_10180 [Gimesia maris]